jgi:glucose/mannose-6-phosphate isomerase
MGRMTFDAIKTIDRSNMWDKIRELPDQLLRGWDSAVAVPLKPPAKGFDHVVFAGMGGSVVAGDFLQNLFGARFSVPFHVVRSYTCPGFVSSRTLFLASSYSGNTEETLSAARDALSRGASVVCVASGGSLAQMAEDNRLPLVVLPSGYPPRAALGYSLGGFLALADRLKIASISRKELEEAVSILKTSVEEWSRFDSDSLPLRIAGSLRGKLPVVYASIETLQSVASRWKTQLNENSKTPVLVEVLPEMNHNGIMTWDVHAGTRVVVSGFEVVLLRVSDDLPRIQKRLDLVREFVRSGQGEVIEVFGEGNSLLSRLLYLIVLGDFVSFFLAVMYDVDPTEIPLISRLKQTLQSIPLS